MLAVGTYTQEYVDASRARIEELLAAYEAMVAAGGKSTAFKSAAADFESQFLANMVLALDECFLHRTRAVEGKDGNALNEVRMLCAGVIGDGMLPPDRTIKYRAENSVLGLEIGAPISMDVAAFRSVASAFFAEIEARFVREPVEAR
jgi:hypothetical protein